MQEVTQEQFRQHLVHWRACRESLEYFDANPEMSPQQWYEDLMHPAWMIWLVECVHSVNGVFGKSLRCPPYTPHSFMRLYLRDWEGYAPRALENYRSKIKKDYPWSYIAEVMTDIARVEEEKRP